jgi:hypothetical protein
MEPFQIAAVLMSLATAGVLASPLIGCGYGVQVPACE